MVNYRAAKACKGLNCNVRQLPVILAIGAQPGSNCALITKTIGCGYDTAFNRLTLLLTKSTFATKQNKRYYLTATGQRVYDLFTSVYAVEYDKLYAKIKAEIVAELVGSKLS